MNDAATNRDLYLFIAALVKKHSSTALPLESYLANLLHLGRARSSRPTLTLFEFAGLLEAAFEAPAPTAAPHPNPAEDYPEWEARIVEQIRDLREMKKAGTLSDPQRYFGIDAPSGARWYNFDPCTFLECAAEGTFGGWEEGDDTARAYVPDPVAVLDPSGALNTMAPRDIDAPVLELAEISWPQFVEFLGAGQCYE